MLDPSLDTVQLASVFQIKSRIQIRNALLPEFAERLHYCLDEEVPWGVAYMGSDSNPRILTSENVSNFSGGDWAAINNEVLKNAVNGFQFLYNSYMMLNAYKEKRNPDLILHRVLEYLNSEHFLAFVRAVTDCTDITRVDAQATRYIPGSFLKRHNDINQAGNRRIAYVLNLTRDWQVDWGGILQFLDNGGCIEETHFPSFNSLTLFQVPMWHNVSYVVPYASSARYAITGWAMSS
ncbi:MAG: 2OG-Fe(II) oxygenase [Gammaproteobacteria bacterium]